MRPKKAFKTIDIHSYQSKMQNLLIMMDTDSLGGRKPENDTNNFGRCTLGDPVLNQKIMYSLKWIIGTIRIFNTVSIC